jgi:hypothetical protein
MCENGIIRFVQNLKGMGLSIQILRVGGAECKHSKCYGYKRKPEHIYSTYICIYLYKYQVVRW